jgi:hypothetical protein
MLHSDTTEATLVTKEDLAKALAHSLNYHGIDAKTTTPDFLLAERLVPEMWKHLFGETDVQTVEKMTPEERRKI